MYLQTARGQFELLDMMRRWLVIEMRNAQGLATSNFMRKDVCVVKGLRMKKTELLITRTKREYKIKRNYTCQSPFCVYVLTCKMCMAQYTGQTTQTVQKCHYGHWSEIKRCEEGMEAHFHSHALDNDMGINLNSQIDDIMKFCQLTIVGNVKPVKPGSRARLDKFEANIQNRLMTMEQQGGINLREEIKRGRRTGQ